MPKKYTCRHCGKKIKQVRTTHGARITLDAKPNPRGTYRMIQRWNFAMQDQEDLAVPLTRHDRATAVEHDIKRWIPHLSVCTGPPKPRRMVPAEERD